VAVDLDQQFVLSQLARRGPWNDCANLPAVVEAASQQTRVGLVLADAEFDSERNHTYIRKRLGAQSVISRQTWKENLARARSARRDAMCIPATDLSPPRPDREPVLFGQTKTLGSCPGSLAAHADASNPAAWIEFQYVSVETSPPFPEDVNRARCSVE